MKGIILAGGSGTRLYPITRAISKQLMPIYDKPMIYYPLSNLIEAGIKDILLITTADQQAGFKNLLGDGSQLGCNFSYTVQDEPRGLADAFIVGRDFIGDDSVTLILGDNIFYGDDISDAIANNMSPDGGIVFASKVHDPERYGVVEFDESGKVLSIEEKPEQPKSNFAIPGLYIFDNQVVELAPKVEPSERGEIEITEIHNAYLEQGKLSVEQLEKGTVWLDTGTFDSMVAAAEYVRVIEKRQDIKVGCIEEAAYKAGLINADQLEELARPLKKSGLRRIPIQDKIDIYEKLPKAPSGAA